MMVAFNASVDLPPTPQAPRAARHAVQALLRVWGSTHSEVDVQLLVTELVTNAVKHIGGESCLLLQIGLSDGWLRLSLADGRSMEPLLRQLKGSAERGRGVTVLETVADSWGSEERHGGTQVWFELRPPDELRRER